MVEFNETITEYKNNAIMHWNASREGDYKTANKCYAKLREIYIELFDNEELKENIMSHLLNDSNYAVQTWAAAHCLGYNLYIKDAESRLKKISKLSGKEAPSFEAEMTLKEWKRKRELTF